MVLSETYYQSVEKRIEWLTLAVTGAGAILGSLEWGWWAGAGFAAGGLLSWINFRWLDDIVTALISTSTAESNGVQGAVSHWIYARFFGRLVLMVVAAYVILRAPWLPGRAVLAGLFSLIFAVLLEVSYEIVTGLRDPSSRL